MESAGTNQRIWEMLLHPEGPKNLTELRSESCDAFSPMTDNVLITFLLLDLGPFLKERKEEIYAWISKTQIAKQQHINADLLDPPALGKLKPPRKANFES